MILNSAYYFLNDVLLPCAREIKFLSVAVTDKLEFKKHVKSCAPPPIF